jgi:FixJ family two-component response regulator
MKERVESFLQELTPTEKKYLALMADGLKDEHIADHFVVALMTVKKHRTHINQKFRATGLADHSHNLRVLLTSLIHKYNLSTILHLD